MLDIQLLRKDLPAVAARIATRGIEIGWDEFTALEKRRKEIQTAVQDTQAAQNRISKEIGQAKAKGLDAAELVRSAETYKSQLAGWERELADIQARLDAFLLKASDDDLSTRALELKRQIRKPHTVDVSNRTAYCGTYGQPMLYVPISMRGVLESYFKDFDNVLSAGSVGLVTKSHFSRLLSTMKLDVSENELTALPPGKRSQRPRAKVHGRGRRDRRWLDTAAQHVRECRWGRRDWRTAHTAGRGRGSWCSSAPAQSRVRAQTEFWHAHHREKCHRANANQFDQNGGRGRTSVARRKCP
jgi:hypothetical protein